MDDDDAIRQKAHELWEAEGRPVGRDASHWAEAKEIVALKESFDSTLKPLDETIAEPVEPILAVENQAEAPDFLTDQGEGQTIPSRVAAAETAVELPLSVEKKKKRPAKSPAKT